MESKQWQFRWRGQNKGKQCSASDEARHKCSYHSIFVATKVCLLILTKVFYGIEFWVRRAINSSLSSNFGRWARKSSSIALSFIITSILFQFVTSSRELLLHGIFACVCYLRNLFYRMSVKIEQHNGCSFFGRQSGESKVEILISIFCISITCA